MTRKWMFLMLGFVMFAFVFSNTPLPAQEKKSEDIMDISLDDLLNVKITSAGKKAEKISEIPASVVLITRDDIQKYGYETLEEILQNVPGMYMIDDFFWVGGVNYGVRGFFATGAFKDMIIMVNGVSQMEDNFDSETPGFISVPVEAIDRIEIVRGPMSVIYGSGAFFGSINIITNQEVEKPVSMIAIGGGSHETYKLFGRAAGTSGDIKYFFNAGYYTTYGLDVPFSDMTSDMAGLSAMTNLPMNAKTGGMLKERRKFVNFSGSMKNFFVDFSHSFVEKGMIDGMPGVGEGHMANLNVTHITFGYKKTFSEKVNLTSSIHYRNGEDYADYRYIDPLSYGFNRIKNDAVELMADIFFTISPQLDITSGLNFRDTFNNEAGYDIPDVGAFNVKIKIPNNEDQKRGSIYSQLNFKPTEKLKFTAGVRLDKVWGYDVIGTVGESLATMTIFNYKYNPTKINVVPRIAAIYSINDRNVFKLMYGEAIKNPSFGENFDITLYGGLLPDLLPAKIKTIEVNYLGAFSSRFNMTLSVFMNKLDKLITRANYVTPDGVSFVTINSGKMNTTGVEAGFQLIPIENLKFDITGTYQKSKDKRAGYEDIELGYSPKFLGYIKVDYKIKNVGIAFTGRYIGKMQTRYDELLEKRIGDPIEAYFVLDGNLHFDNLFNKGLFLNLKVNDILNQEIRYPTTNSNTWADRGYLGKKLGFLVTAGWKF